MRYKPCGRSGFGPDWGWGADKDVSRAMFDAFAEAGGNVIDTANRYTNGTAEQYVGEFGQGGRARFVVATKYGDPNAWVIARANTLAERGALGAGVVTGKYNDDPKAGGGAAEWGPRGPSAGSDPGRRR